MKVYFKRGHCWQFQWSDQHQCWFYNTRQNVYRIFIDAQGLEHAHIWIGREFREKDGSRWWGTVERHLGAVKIEGFNFDIVFK